MLCRARSRVQCRASRSWPVRTCDDLRLVGLKLIFLTVSSAMSLLRLSRREEWWKDAEILTLRRQLAVALGERPRAAARLTWPDRAWLALLAGTLPIDRLAGMRLIVTPATILRWHRGIVRRGWARRSRRGRSGRPPVRRVLAVIEHDTRRIRVLGATENPVQSWVVQQARNLLMDLEDAGMSVKFVLHDRDASFTAAFDAVFQAAGVRVVRSAIQAPRMNSIMERWIGSCRRDAGPDLDLEPAPPDDRPARVRGLLQHAPATPPLNQAAPLRPPPDGVTDLDHFRFRRRDRAGGVIHEYRLMA
jgi:hypothetical protein